MGDYIPTVVVEDAYEGTGNHARSTINTNQLISQLKAVAENPDTLKGASDSQLQDLRRYCREADERFEKPFETLRRMAYSVGAFPALIVDNIAYIATIAP